MCFRKKSNNSKEIGFDNSICSLVEQILYLGHVRGSQRPVFDLVLVRHF